MKRNLLLLFAFIALTFSGNAQVSMIGPGASGDWGVDVDLTSTDGNIWTLTDFTMPGGEFKFRLNHDWTTAWGNGLGGATFPVGVSDTTPGPDNNITAVAGTYSLITFNQTTGDFSFVGGEPVAAVSISGTAVNPPEGVNLTTADGSIYTISDITFVDGNAQFSIDGSLFGGTGFPDGNATDPSSFIPVVGGTYSTVTYNIDTGDYSFAAAPVFPVISLIGSGTTGTGAGWDNLTGDIDMTTTDGVIYRLNAQQLYSVNTDDSTPGALKFRTGHNWSNPNYGGVTFPTGPDLGNPTGDIIVTAPGTYDVVFNLTTKEYSFSFPLISLTGAAFGGWGDGFDFDLSTTDGANYSIQSITAIAADGGKFRSNHSWDAPNLAYGSSEFPTGTATPTGGDLQITPGVYGVTFNRVTGLFNFGEPLATASFNTSDFRVYPNPTNNVWNINATQNIESIRIIDVLGKTVMTVSPKNISATVDASALNTGIYFARIATADSNTTVKLVKN